MSLVSRRSLTPAGQSQMDFRSNEADRTVPDIKPAPSADLSLHGHNP